jgi:hypothetical protein
MNDHSCHRFRFLIPFAIAGFVAVFTFAVYALWNGVVSDVLGVKTITYWQALGLLVLCKILFGGFPGRGRGFGPPWREKMMWKRHWHSLTPEQRANLRDEMREQFGHWASLTPEQKQNLREKMRQKFGNWPRPPWGECDDPRSGDAEKKD